MTLGVVLAAGASRRMGIPKPLLEWRGQTWIAHAVGRMTTAGCATVCAVVADASVAQAGTSAGATVIWNDQPNLGMLHSVQLALCAGPEPKRVVVCPCDMPTISVATFRAVLEATGPSNVVVPSFEGKNGHPVAFGHEWPKKILRMDARRHGLDRLLKDAGCRLTRVAVDDPGCRIDFDTFGEWQGFLNNVEDGAGYG